MQEVITKGADTLKGLNDVIMAVLRFLIIAVVAIIAVIMMSSVFWRYVLDNSIPWSEEGCKYLMVWLAFLGAPVALRHGNHINIDLLMMQFGARGQQFFHFLINLVIVVTMGIILWKGIGFAQLGARQVASSFNFSMLYMYIAVPIGCALTILVALEYCLRGLAGIFNPDAGLSIDHAAFADEIRE